MAQGGYDDRRSLEWLNRGLRGVFRTPRRIAIRCGDAGSTSPEKIALIEAYGGACRLIDDPNGIIDEAQRLAAESDVHFVDQFTYAERAMDWRSNNNIAESIFAQMAHEPYPVPTWVVVGAGTGGTSATIGRYLRFGRHATRLCVVDPEDSIFYASWAGDPAAFTGRPSRIEGIGRQRLEPSFLADVVDHMIQVPDAASVATMRLVSALTAELSALRQARTSGGPCSSWRRWSRVASAAAS